jgi:hypothetical protein
MSAFLYRHPFLLNEDGQKKDYYETSSLRFYRKKLEEKAFTMNVEIKCAPGFGAPIKLNYAPKNAVAQSSVNIKNKTTISGTDFLEQYRNDIAALPEACENDNYLKTLNEKEKQIFTTLLPYTAAIKKRNPQLELNDLIEEVKRRAVNEIDKLI